MQFYVRADAPSKPFNKHWKFCVGSGHAALAMRTDYVSQLKFIHDELGIERVRFHGIFCDDMHTLHSLKDLFPLPGGKKYTERSFRLCGLVYDNVLSTGMKPFVELGFMPKMLAKRPNRRGLFFYKPIVSMPRSLAEWADYIKAFVRFLIDRYGSTEVESWFFEVWNEPDLTIPFFAGTQKDYFALYRATALAVKEVISKIQVGGPSTSQCKWISEFVEFCKSSGTPLDFVSTHQYAGDPLGGIDADGNDSNSKQSGGIKISAMLKQILHPFKDAKDDKLLSAYRSFMPDKSETEDLPQDTFRANAIATKRRAEGKPVFYTEWNENAIFSAYTNDTKKVAAYDVKAALDVEDYADGSSIWCFSDIFEELHPFPEEFHGGFGMLTQHGIPKPLFYALKMLNDCGEDRLILDHNDENGEISLAAFKKSDSLQFIATRQNLKSGDNTKEDLTICVQLPQKPSAVKMRVVDNDNGNPLKVWEEDGKKLDLTPKEVQSIIQKSRVTESDADFCYDGSTLTLRTALAVNDVCFFNVIL